MDVGEEKQKLLLQKLRDMKKNAVEKINLTPPKKRGGRKNNTDSQNNIDIYYFDSKISSYTDI